MGKKLDICSRREMSKTGTTDDDECDDRKHSGRNQGDGNPQREPSATKPL